MTLAVAVGYAIGSVPFALLLARRWGTADPRTIGSGNPGAANVARAYGVGRGVIVALLDIAKGALSVALARQMSDQSIVPAAAGLAAVVGHIYPVWLRFRGGKGVATTCGVFAVLMPIGIAPVLAIFAATVWLTKYVSLGSVVASLALPPIAYLADSPRSTVVAAWAASALIVFRHRSNVARLVTGQERRLGTLDRALADRPIED